MTVDETEILLYYIYYSASLSNVDSLDTFLLVVVIVLSVIITQTMIIPVVVNYEHGLFHSPDFTISKSSIQGVGLYTKRKRSKGENLFVAINSNKKVTPIGSKINHCPSKRNSERSIPPEYISLDNAR